MTCMKCWYLALNSYSCVVCNFRICISCKNGLFFCMNCAQNATNFLNHKLNMDLILNVQSKNRCLDKVNTHITKNLMWLNQYAITTNELENSVISTENPYLLENSALHERIIQESKDQEEIVSIKSKIQDGISNLESKVQIIRMFSGNVTFDLTAPSKEEINQVVDMLQVVHEKVNFCLILKIRSSTDLSFELIPQGILIKSYFNQVG